MSPIDLESALPGSVRRRELRDRRGSAVVKHRAKETAVDAIILEVLVHTDEILRAIAEIRGIERSRIDHRRRAWQIVRCGGSAGTREDIVCGFQNRCPYDVGGYVGIQNLGSKRIRIVGLGPRRKRAICKGLSHTARGIGRTQRLHAKKKKNWRCG